MSANCDVIAIFLIYGQFGEFRKMDSGRKTVWSVKPTFSLIVTFCVTKTDNSTEKYLTQLSYYS